MNNIHGKVFTMFRGQPDLIPTAAKEFGGVDYCTRFSSSAPIFLESVAFYRRKLTGDEYIDKYVPSAPGNTKKVKKPDQRVPAVWAALVLEIRQSKWFYPTVKDANRQVFMKKMAIEVDVSKFTEQEVFFVKLPYPIAIPPKMVFDVVFQLYGIDQRLKFHCLSASDNFSKVYPITGCNVDIQVHLSSAQCAGFQFRLDDESTSVSNEPASTSSLSPQVKPSLPAMQNKKKMKKGAKAVKYLANVIGVFDNFPIK